MSYKLPEIGFNFFLHKLKLKENFSLVRYGDGEWGAMIGYEPVINIIKKRDDEKAIDFSKKFIDVFESKPNYYIGVQPASEKMLGDRIKKYYNDLPKVVNGDTFHEMSRSIGIRTFLDIVKNKKVIIVGPDYFNKLNFDFEHIITPTKKVWNHYDEVKTNVLQNIGKFIEQDIIVLYSCSFAAKLLIHDVYNIYQESITQIDMGSLFDPYCDINSRTYHGEVLKKINSKNEQWCI